MLTSITKRIYSDFVSATNCSGAADTFECMVDVDVEVLEIANKEVAVDYLLYSPVTAPVVDGELDEEVVFWSGLRIWTGN